MVDRWTAPIAYHLTFTTYGTWLHGDERGSVTRKARKYVAPDPVLNEYMKERLNYPKVALEAHARKIVHDAVEDYCEFKSWPLLALNVRTNHVHVVVKALDTASKMLHGIKSRATRVLRDTGDFERNQPVWTERGNKGLLKTEEAVANAIDYVLDHQGPDI
ncbi:MAG: transposase [Planctomycetes bacterium]|nr:transposase [Planctomycetota bacterium]